MNHTLSVRISRFEGLVFCLYGCPLLAQPCHSFMTILPLTYLISQNITTNPIANFATPPTHPITHKKRQSSHPAHFLNSLHLPLIHKNSQQITPGNNGGHSKVMIAKIKMSKSVILWVTSIKLL